MIYSAIVRIANVKAAKCLTILPASQLTEAISFKMMVAQRSAVFQHKHCTMMPAGKSLRNIFLFLLGRFEHILLDPLDLHDTQVAFTIIKDLMLLQGVIFTGTPLKS